MHSNQKIRIKLKAYDHELLDRSAQRIVDTVKSTGTKVSGPVPLPTDREVITVLRAVHKYKRHEVGKMLDMPTATVTWTYNKAISKLKKKLEEEQ